MIAGSVVPGHGRVGDAAMANRQAADLALMAELGRRVVSGELGTGEAVAAAPFPAETANVALVRSARELEPDAAR